MPDASTMTNFIKVFPTKASALNIPADAKHPKLTVDGVMWPLHDTFTKRRLRDGSVTKDEADAYKPEPAKSEPAAAPAAAEPAATPAAEAETPAAEKPETAAPAKV